MKRNLTLCILAVSASTVFSQNFTVNFDYTQTDFATGSGTIAPFSLLGHDFTATPLPSATVLSPGGAPSSGFVGRINAQAGAANEANQAVGLLWSGFVTATATDGATIQIPLTFAPKQTQTPDASDYHWSISYSDAPTDGNDAIGTALRFAMLFSRDTTIDATETPNTFQRYTQLTQNFVAGPDNFTNTDTTNGTIKDAQDPAGAPLGTDAVGRNLEFYWAWRDGGALTNTSILVNDFAVSGLLVPDQATLVPEPSTTALALIGAAALLRRRRK